MLKRIVKILGWTLGSLAGLLLLLYGVICIPAVQKKLTNVVVGKLGDFIGLRVEIESVYPILWEGLALKNVVIYDTQNDTAFNVAGMFAKLNVLDLDSSYVSLSKVSLYKPHIHIVKDTIGIMNIAPLLATFQSSDTTSKFRFEIDEMKIRDGRFCYKDETKEQQIPHRVNFGNIQISDLFFHAHDFSMFDGTYNLAIDKLSCDEQSGFKLQYLHTNVLLCDSLLRCGDVAIYTPESKISADKFEMAFNSFSAFSNFCDSVKLSAYFNRTTTSLHDISYFASSLEKMPYSFSVEGFVEGTIADFSANDVHIGFGRSTQFVGSISAKGLPDIENTEFVVDAKNVETNLYDISHTRIPPFDSVNFVSLPSFLEKITFYKFVGKVQGVWSDLSAKGMLFTNAGKISTDASLKQDKTSQCSGTITFEDFNLSEFVGSEIIGKTTGDFSVDARFNSDSLINANIVGNLAKLNFNGYDYSGLDIDGKLSAHKFMGLFAVADPNLDMHFGGLVDISKDVPEFRFKSKVASAKLSELNLYADSLADVSFALDVDFRGMDLDNMTGDVTLRDVSYKNAKGGLSTKLMKLSARHENGIRNVDFSSSFVDATIEGDGSFKDLSYELYNLLQKHIPAFPVSEEKQLNLSNCKMKVSVKDVDTLFALFQSDVRISNGAIILARFDKNDTLCSVRAHIPKITFNEMQLYNCNAYVHCSNASIITDMEVFLDSTHNRKRNFYDDNKTNAVALTGYISNDSLDFTTKWDYGVSSLKTSGTMQVLGNMFSRGDYKLPKFNLQVSPREIQFADSLWQIAKSNIVVDSSSISISDFAFTKNEKKITIDGTISENPDDYIVVNVQNYDLCELNPIINNPHVRLAGGLEGRVRVKNIYNTPLLFVDIHSPEISFNENKLGEMRVRSFWDNKFKALLMNASIRNGENPIVGLEGKYVPSSDTLHFDVEVNDLRLETFAEILQGTVNDIEGIANGDIDVDGTLSNMKYSGELALSDGVMAVDYTHVPYTFSGLLQAHDTKFFFTDFKVFDATKNSGDILGYLDLKDITNPYYVFNIQTPKLLVMKTTAKDNDYFYGTVLYNGSARIEGDLNQTKISCQGKTLENTVCSIPVSYSELSGAYDFLFFSNDSVTLPTYEKQTSASGLTMDLVLDVTPDAQAQIIFDPKVGDIIKVRGAGNLQVKMDASGDMSMYGKYQIEEGDYLFTLKNLINKKLIIQKGGTIAWNGDPLNAQVDLLANYETKASPQSLLDSSVSATKRIPVTCQIHLENNLLSPDISYNILVPSSATQVSEVLATLSEDEKTLQFVSLMLQSSFMSLNSDAGVGSSVSFEVLSNQFNNLLSQIDPNMDVNVNYRMGTDNTTNSEFEFGFSRQFWNDRILVNVNGYTDFGESGTTESVANQSQSSDFSGNVSVEMKINKKGTFKVKGFSRSNDDELSEKQENTNGVGLFFTKDFNTIRDLFRKED